MRIFVLHYNLNNLNNKINELDKYLVNTTTYHECVSKEGIFHIDQSNIYKLKHNDGKIIKCQNYANNLDIIVDYSETEKTKEYQIPPDSIVLSFYNSYYSLASNSKIKMVVQKMQKVNETVISDFYFEINEKNNEKIDIHNIFVKKELNVFLSLLN